MRMKIGIILLLIAGSVCIASVEARVVREEGINPRSIEFVNRIERYLKTDNIEAIVVLITDHIKLWSMNRWQSVLKHAADEDYKAHVYVALSITCAEIKEYERAVTFNEKAGDEFSFHNNFGRAVFSYSFAAKLSAGRLHDNKRSRENNMKQALSLEKRGKFLSVRGEHLAAARTFEEAMHVAGEFLNDLELVERFALEAGNSYENGDMFEEAERVYRELNKYRRKKTF